MYSYLSSVCYPLPTNCKGLIKAGLNIVKDQGQIFLWQKFEREKSAVRSLRIHTKEIVMLRQRKVR